MNFSKNIFTCLVIFKITSAQLNGEFWWLNDKVKQLKGIEPPSPKFEDLGEFDTDESSKIIFRDEEYVFKDEGNVNFIKNKKHTKKENPEEHITESANIVWPHNNIQLNTPSKEPAKVAHEGTKHVNRKENDLFVFKFPDDDYLMTTRRPLGSNKPIKEISEPSNPAKAVTSTTISDNNIIFKSTYDDLGKWSNQQSISKQKATITGRKNIYNQKFVDQDSLPRDHNATDNICTYMKATMCKQKNGVIYTDKGFVNNGIAHSSYTSICCVLPLHRENKDKIVFPDSSIKIFKRFKRSNIEIKSPLHHREILLRKKFSTQIAKPTGTKIVTPDDDYVDPYWNIKNSNFKNYNTQGNMKPNCDYHDYVEDYTVELPKPGLVGIYSDYGHRPSTYPNNDGNIKPSYGSYDYSYEDYETPHGYSTTDHRRGTTSKGPKGGRPVRITSTTSTPKDDVTIDVESQTIGFPSNPNFQVLQSFKLLNLARNKNKFYSKNTKRSTTEANIENESREYMNMGEEGENLAQIYKQCGKTLTNQENSLSQEGIGKAEMGSHPWLIVVVSPQRPQIILCYATLVHPRVAITAGDCVSNYTKQERSNEAISVLAGFHNLKDKSHAQERTVTIKLHPQWGQNNLAHNLALLHWARPLRLNNNVQPACLLTSPDSEYCKFYGWGGFDQALRQEAHWQRASIISSQDCRSKFFKNMKLPSDAYCATVQTRGTVTGMGGSLICRIENRAYSAGVAVYRDNALVLIPAHEWILRAMTDLNIE